MDDLAYASTLCFLTLGPLKTIPPFYLATQGADRRTVRTLALRSTLVAAAVVLFVALVASGTMASWRVSLDALAIAGGLVLLITSVKTLSSFQLIETPAPPAGVETPAEPAGGAVPAPPASTRWMGRPVLSPLAIPAIVPPVGVVVILLFAGLTVGDRARQAQLVGLLLAILAVDFVAMLFAGPILRRIGLPVLQVVGWVFSALQAGLAIQAILDAVRHLEVVP